MFITLTLVALGSYYGKAAWEAIKGTSDSPALDPNDPLSGVQELFASRRNSSNELEQQSLASSSSSGRAIGNPNSGNGSAAPILSPVGNDSSAENAQSGHGDDSAHDHAE